MLRNMRCVRLATMLRCVVTCWVLLAQVWKWSNLSQHPTCRKMSQQGDQTHATCCAQQCCDMLGWHVATVWPGLYIFKWWIVEKFVLPTFYLMQIVRVSLLFTPTPPILSHIHNAAAWPYEMKYIKSYCYFGIYNSLAFMFAVPFLYYYKRSRFLPME